MKKIFALLCICLLAGCFTRGSLMTRESFDAIELGSSIVDVTAKVGEPYAIERKGKGIDEYEYVEKIQMREVVEENHYFLIVNNGLVVGKSITTYRPPAYDLIYQDDPNYTNY